MARPKKPPPRQAAQDTRRWGLYTLGFLVLAFVMVVVSSTAGHYNPLTLLGLLVGFVGASYCTVKGMKKARNFRLARSDD